MASPKPLLRVMVDSNVLIAGIGWRRFPHYVLWHAIRDYRLVLSPLIIEEVTEHTGRLFPARLAELETYLEEADYELAPNPTHEELIANKDIVRDREDIAIVLAAINAKVDYFISQDKDITDPAQPVHEKLKVILPGTFLREHMGWTSEQLEQVRDAK